MVDNAPPPQKSRVKWVILIFVLLLLGGAAAGAWFFFLQDTVLSPENAAPQASKKTEAEPAPNPGASTMIVLPPFTTNLADPLGQRFIRVHLEVEVANSRVAEEMARFNARVRDSIIILLSSKTYADIAGAESKVILKSEITDRLNTILGPGKVYQVFITDMVIQ